jgi:RNA polymerase sigma factor (sigma-70 family)
MGSTEGTGIEPHDRLTDPTVLITRHMAAARAVAARFAGQGVGIDDLHGEAYLALCQAALRYDILTHPNSSFWGFALPRVQGALKDAIRRAPICPFDRCEAAPDDFGTLMVSALDDEDLKARVDEALAHCTPTGRAVLRLVAQEGCSLREAAGRLGLTRWRVKAEHNEACLTLAARFRATA